VCAVCVRVRSCVSMCVRACPWCVSVCSCVAVHVCMVAKLSSPATCTQQHTDTCTMDECIHIRVVCFRLFILRVCFCFVFLFVCTLSTMYNGNTTDAISLSAIKLKAFVKPLQ